ncbi:MAG: Gfo/Idh/MocA family oxidoreductase, partial [Micromonosporaceae bacterium]|nr:Gfo/Idh/MocA family oxidoreductase [Micromonosporaceae bacterium]
MNGVVRWGVLGTGHMAHRMATAIQATPGCRLAAVGSRSTNRAESFAAQFGIPESHGSYQGLCQRAAVDVVYVATPNVYHHEHTMLALESGRGVLVEKPFAIDAREAAQMITYARDRGLFLMEAMWTRHLPATQLLRDLVTRGDIGTPHLLTVDLGFRADPDPAGRWFNPRLGGGALLDVGVYTLSLATMLFGPPTVVTGAAVIGTSGVDEYASVLLTHPGQQATTATMSLVTDLPRQAVVTGSDGWLRLGPPFHRAAGVSLGRPGLPEETIAAPFDGDGYGHQIRQVASCL